MNPLERPLRRLEHLMGARRDDRSLWAWTGPIATLVVTFVFLILFGVVTRIDLGLTIPMALVMSVFLGTLSAFYLTAASADERDADDDDGSRPQVTPPTGGSSADVVGRQPSAQVSGPMIHPASSPQHQARQGAVVEKELAPTADARRPRPR